MSRLSHGIAAAAASGAVLALFDLLLAPHHPGVATTVPLVERLAILLVLPGAAGALGLLAGVLPGAWTLALPAAAAWYLGDRLAQGARASHMPLAAWWGAILAAAALSCAAFLRRLGARATPSRRRGLAAVMLIAAVALYLAGALTQRGRYENVRLGVMILAGMLLCSGLARLTRPPRGWIGPAAAVAALASLVVGVTVAVRSAPAAEWAVTRGSAAAPLVALAREALARPLPAVAGAGIERAPYFGTELAAESRRLLGPVDGVLLVTVDAMRTDVVGAKVGGRAVTPHLDRRGGAGCRFTRAYTAAPISMNALFSLLSGVYPSHIVDGPEAYDGVPLLTARLEAAGVETRSSFCLGMLTLRKYLDDETLGFRHITGHAWKDLGVDETFEALKPARGGRWFSYLHLMGPHFSYDGAAPEFRAGTSDFELYASEVRQADDVIERLLTRFEAAGLLERTLVIVSADHGEEFLEHGGTQHGTQLFEEVAHVPLVVFGAGVRSGVVEQVVSLADIAPTLEQVFDLPPQSRPPYAGRSLLPALVGLDDPHRLDAALVEDYLPGAAARSAIVSARWKLVHDERLSLIQLYDLTSDPGETRNVAEEHPEVAARELARLESLRRPLSTETEEPEPVSAADVLRERGDHLELVELYALLLSRPDLPRDLLIRFLCRFAYTGLPGRDMTRALVRTYAGTDDLEIDRVRAVLALAQDVDGGPAAERTLDELVDSFETIDDADLAAALVWALAIRKDERLKDRRPAEATGRDMGVRLALALQAFRLEATAPPDDLIAAAVAHPSASITGRAAKLVTMTQRTGCFTTLRSAYRRMEIPRIRIAILEAITAQDDPRVDAFLLGRIERGPAAECRRALPAYVTRNATADGVATRPLWSEEHRAKAHGIGPLTDYYAPLAAPEADLPVHTFEEGTLVGIYVRSTAVPHSADEPRLRVSLGKHTRLLKRLPTRDLHPLTIWLPPAAQGDHLRLTLENGAAPHVLVGGTVSLRAPEKPRSPLALRR